MTPAEIAAHLQQYTAAGYDLSQAWWVCFALGLNNWAAPPAYLAAIRGLGLAAAETLEEQGGRPVVHCRHHTVPTAAGVAAKWAALDAVARAHRMPPVECFWLQRV